MPAPEDLAALTETVMRANGFAPKRPVIPTPPPIRHVVLIVKEGRTYDEVLGDIHATPQGPAMSDPEIARYGMNGVAEGGHQRLSLKGVRVTPNTHAIATQWAFSDNFYADGDGTVDGHHWLAGVYPNAWTETSLFAAYGNLKDFRMSAAPGRLAFPGMASSVLPEDAARGQPLEPFGEPPHFVLQLWRGLRSAGCGAAARHAAARRALSHRHANAGGAP